MGKLFKGRQPYTLLGTMKSKTFQHTDIDELDKAVNAFDDVKEVKFQQSATAYDVSRQAVVTTVRVFYEDK